MGVFINQGHRNKRHEAARGLFQREAHREPAERLDKGKTGQKERRIEGSEWETRSEEKRNHTQMSRS